MSKVLSHLNDAWADSTPDSHLVLSPDPSHHFAGIDVGGTDVKVGVVNHVGQIVDHQRTATTSLRTPRAVFRHAIDFARYAITRLNQGSSGDAHAHLAAVGSAVPGVLDTSAFELREVVNLPGWLNQPLRTLLREACDLPAAVVNDANAAAFAEHAMRGLGERSLGLVTLGTGVGCGLVLRGSPFGGDHGCAGELGHIAIEFGEDALPCTCGSRGHLESYAGASGVLARLKERMKSHEHGLSTEVDSPREIAELASNGDEDCLAVIDETAAYVGRAIGLLCQSTDPDVVLIGGAMTFGGEATTTGKRFLVRVREEVRATTLVQVGQNVTVDFATLKNNAGILGAAKLASTLVK